MSFPVMLLTSLLWFHCETYSPYSAARIVGARIPDMHGLCSRLDMDSGSE